VQPTEYINSSLYCIGEQGGKIGRHSCNQMVVLEESVSRYHAEIVFDEGKFKIADIGSTTGTFIKI
jgi:pSer/pThr/pTyr-binding forkhead associated (FHA) protein